MAQTRSRRYNRWGFALFSAVSFFVMGRNVYHRHLDAALAVAVDKGNLADARELLNKGANVDAPQYAPPLLMLALSRLSVHTSTAAISSAGVPSSANYPDAEAIACLLISKQIDLRLPHTIYRNGQQTITGYDAAGYIREACKYGSVPLLRGLLDKGVQPTPECLDSALLYRDERYFGDAFYGLPATNQRGKVNAAVAAENAGRRVLRNEISRQMVTPLREHGACPTPAQCVEMNDIAALKAKLDAETSPNPKAGTASSLLPLAVSRNNREMVGLLLERGADVNRSMALSAAVDADNLELVKLLLAQGAGAGAKEDALREAVAHKRKNMVQLLLARGAHVDARSLVWQTLYHSAYEARHKDVLDLLQLAGFTPMQNKPDLNVKNKLGETSLLAALGQGQSEMAQSLVAQGADVNAQDMYGHTPLAEAVLHCPSLVPDLLRFGANPNMFAPIEGGTPLYLAVNKNDVPTVRLLLKYKADFNLCPPRGHTPLFRARRHNQTEMVQILQAAGATEDK